VFAFLFAILSSIGLGRNKYTQHSDEDNVLIHDDELQLLSHPTSPIPTSLRKSQGRRHARTSLDDFNELEETLNDIMTENEDTFTSFLNTYSERRFHHNPILNYWFRNIEKARQFLSSVSFLSAIFTSSHPSGVKR